MKANTWSMIPKKPAPDLIRGMQRFSEKIILEQSCVTRNQEPHQQWRRNY